MTSLPQDTREPPAGVAVKELEWFEHDENIWRADSIIGEFEVGFDDDDWYATLDGFKWEWRPDSHSDQGPSAGKAACKGYLETRIRSALSPSAPPAEQPQAAHWSDEVEIAPGVRGLRSQAAPDKREAQAIERAYGILWRDVSRGSAEKSVAARKELFAVLTKEGQKRGIEYALALYGPTTEIEVIDAEEPAPDKSEPVAWETLDGTRSITKAELDAIRDAVAAITGCVIDNEDAAEIALAASPDIAIRALEVFAADESWRTNGVCDAESSYFRGQEIAREALALLKEPS